MRKRCNDPSRKDYYLYGARGVEVCSEWGSFENFCQWALQNGYDDTLTIDRIDSDGNYEPSNCRWATKAEQARNTSRNRKFLVDGKWLTIAEIASDLSMNYTTLWNRLYISNMSIEEAISKPLRSGGYKRLIWR